MSTFCVKPRRSSCVCCVFHAGQVEYSPAVVADAMEDLVEYLPQAAAEAMAP